MTSGENDNNLGMESLFQLISQITFVERQKHHTDGHLKQPKRRKNDCQLEFDGESWDSGVEIWRAHEKRMVWWIFHRLGKWKLENAKGILYS